jgi:hypothetical protein
MTKAICEDCGSLVDAELTHNGVCEVGHYVHCGWGHMLSPSDLISDAAADRIEELEAKLAWQPIETAPKDGTRVLAYWPDCYGNHSACQVETWFGPWAKGNSQMVWQSAFEWADGHNEPTHWMPLPAPPAGEDRG